MTEFLRRYTNIPALIHLLAAQKITLLDPVSWDDKNDSHFLSLYREKKSLTSVLALCFTQTTETYHHWRVFADGSSGVCITFDKAELLAAMKKHPGVTARAVRYLKLPDIRRRRLKVGELPFLKRFPYEDEREFRIIYESSSVKASFLDIDIPLGCIRRITLSPWIPAVLTTDLKSIIRKIDGCARVKLARSTLIGNEQWKDLGEGAK
jgi:hypothetical protein